MRKEYVKPATQVEEFIVESMLATSSGDEHIDIIPGQGGGADVNNRHDSWGNLWD